MPEQAGLGLVLGFTSPLLLSALVIPTRYYVVLTSSVSIKPFPHLRTPSFRSASQLSMSCSVAQAHEFLNAAKAFDWDTVLHMLDSDATLVNQQPSQRWSALHQAAFEPNMYIVSRLLAKRADVNVRSRDGLTPMDIIAGNQGEQNQDTAQQQAETIRSLLSATFINLEEAESENTMPPSVTVATSPEGGGREVASTSSPPPPQEEMGYNEMEQKAEKPDWEA